MGVGGADGFSDANLVGTFGNRYEHKIHDTNAANKEGNTGNNSEHKGDDSIEITDRVGDIVTVIDCKTAWWAFEVGESFIDFVCGILNILIVFDGDVDLLNLRIEGFDLVKVNDDGLIKINTIEVDGIFDFLKGADDDEFMTGERKSFTNWFAGAEEL